MSKRLGGPPCKAPAADRGHLTQRLPPRVIPAAEPTNPPNDARHPPRWGPAACTVPRTQNRRGEIGCSSPTK